MYAVIQTGGKQYRVEPGEVLEIERLAAPAEDGGGLRFEHVLMVGGQPAAPPPADSAQGAAAAPDATAEAGATTERAGGSGAVAAPLLGTPLIAGAVVTASLLGPAKGPKIRVFKTKRRNTQRRTRGHRQHLLRVRIDGIQLPGAAAAGEPRERSES
ncbi:MAG TPA: bL21 family ribosomal protein [Thermoanaerobaculia bacterium]|nr:bL21 family ribosomal protein [Thermoanaerobaculia bacterium]